jgi:hypothetical protein
MGAPAHEKRDLGVPVLAPPRPVEKRTLPLQLYADREDALPRPLHAGQTLAAAKSCPSVAGHGFVRPQIRPRRYLLVFSFLGL